MKISHIITCCCITCVSLAQTNTFQWAKAIGGNQNEYSDGVATDAQDNVYVFGTFVGSVDFDPTSGTDTYTSNGLTDVFISKYDDLGNYIWTLAIGGTLGERVKSVYCDNNNNIYVTGFFNGTVNFNPKGTAVPLTAAMSASNAFIAKYNSNGILTWVKSFGDYGETVSNDVVVDNSGNVYIAGFVDGSVTFPSQSTFYSSSSDIFVIKLNANGDFVWGKTFGSTSDEEALALTLDASNNILITGYFSGTVNFNTSGTTNLTSGGNKDIFVLKLNNSGNYVWAKSYGAAKNERGRDIAVDSDNNVYVTGDLNSVVVYFGSFGISGYGQNSCFLLKLTSAGVETWVKSFGGYGYSYAFSMSIDLNNIIHVAGTFEQTTNFDPAGSGYNLTVESGADVYVALFNTSGVLQYVEHVKAEEDLALAGIAHNNQNHFYVVGDFGSAIKFNHSPNDYVLNGNSQRNVYIAKFGTCPAINNAVSLSGNILTANQSGASYQWINCNNNSPISGATAQSYTPTVNGNYAVKITINGCEETSSCIAVNLVTVGIESLEQNGWSVYPNPGNGLFTIERQPFDHSMAIRVTNTLGQTINIKTTVSGGAIIIDLTNEPTGVYLLMIDNKIEKLIKQ